MTPQERWDNDWSQLMEDARFRRVLLQVIEDPEWCRRGALSFDANAKFAAFQEGMRAIGIKLSNEAQRIAPQFYLRGMRELVDLRRNDAAAQQQIPPEESE